jgi:hypothetical protein
MKLKINPDSKNNKKEYYTLAFNLLIKKDVWTTFKTDSLYLTYR